MVMQLLAAGADIDAWSQIGTPITLAILQTQNDVMHHLLRAGASLTASAGNIGFPLHVACAGDNRDAVAAAIGATTNGRNERNAINQRHLECLKTPNERGNLSSKLDIINRRSENEILEHDREELTPLEVTAMFNSTRALKILLAADVEYRTLSKNGHVGCVRALVHADAALTPRFAGLVLNALHEAAVGNHLAVVEDLLAAGVPVDYGTIRGYTALMAAATSDSVAAGEILPRKGADIHLRDLHSDNAQQHAEVLGDTEFVRMIRRAARPTERG